MSVTTLQYPPAYNPRPTVRVDNDRWPQIDELLLGVELREQEDGLAALSLRLSNVASYNDGRADLAFENERALRLGSRIRVAMGAAGEQEEIFRGIVTGLEAEFPDGGPPELVVLAEDALQQARMRRRTRVHVDVSPGDLVQALAGELGLRAEVSGLGEPAGTWVQLNESDLAFVRRLLRSVDAELRIDGDVLQAAPRSQIQRRLIELTLLEELRGVRFIADLAHQVSAVTSAGWNAASGEAVQGRGEGVNLGPGRGRSGVSLLRDAIGERVEHVGQVAVTSRVEAQALADTLFDRRARRFVVAEGTAAGHPLIRVGAHLELRGVGPRFGNIYHVTSTTHRFTIGEGYLTDFRAECAYLGEPE